MARNVLANFQRECLCKLVGRDGNLGNERILLTVELVQLPKPL